MSKVQCAPDSAASDSTFKPAFMLMAGRIGAFAITFLTPVFLVRIFTQEEYGTYKQFMLVTYTLFLIGQCGFAESLFYFLPKTTDRGGRYAWNSLLMLFVAGAVCFAGLVLSTSRIEHWMNNDEIGRYVPIMGAYLLFMLMGTVLEITMISRKQYKLASVTYVASDLFRAAFLVVPALITGSVAWALVGSLTFFGIRVCAIIGYFRREFGTGPSVDGPVLKEQWGYALPLALAGVVQVIQQNYHQLIVASHFDRTTLAIYSVGCLQIPLVDFMATPASNVMMVRMTEELRDGGVRRLLPIWHDTTRKLALMFFPFVGLLVVNAYHLIVLLFTTAYVQSVPIFMVWCLSILLAAFQTDGVMRVFAQMKYLFGINLTRLFLLFLLMSWFLATFHLMGAVLVTLLGMVLAKIMMLVRIRQVLETTTKQLLPWRHLGGTLAAAMIAALPAALVTLKLSLPSLVILPLSGMTYMATYTALVLMFGLLTEGEKASIKRSLYVWNRWSIKPGRQASI